MVDIFNVQSTFSRLTGINSAACKSIVDTNTYTQKIHPQKNQKIIASCMLNKRQYFS